MDGGYSSNDTVNSLTPVDSRPPRQAARVAIDGPSGSGKSSVSKEVARRLQLAYLDTGAMYRALTWYCLKTGIDLQDAAAVEQASKAMPLEISTTPPREYVRGRRHGRHGRDPGSFHLLGRQCRRHHPRCPDRTDPPPA